MMKLKLTAEERAATGTGSAKEARRKGLVPAVIYGREEETIHIEMPERDFSLAYRDAGAATILGLTVGSEEIPVIIKEVQQDPVKRDILHVDFQKISMDEEIRVTLPIVLVNRDNIKAQPSILTQQLDELEIECLPNKLPGDIEVDVQDMKIGDSITVADLDIANEEGITILRELDDVICALTEFVEEDLEAVEEVDVDAEPELVSDDEDEEVEEDEE